LYRVIYPVYASYSITNSPSFFLEPNINNQLTKQMKRFDAADKGEDFDKAVAEIKKDKSE